MRTMIQKHLLQEMKSNNQEFFSQHWDEGEALPAHWSASLQVKTPVQLCGVHITKLCVIYKTSAPIS